jgi:hypothetical protein
MRIAALSALTLLLLPSLALAGPKFSASSFKDTEKESFDPSKMFDGLLHTSWAEDSPGLGTDQWIEVDLGEDVEVGIVSIWGGLFSGREDWSGRGRLASVTIVFQGPDGEKEKTVEFGDRFAKKDVAINRTIRSFKLTIDEIHEGSIFADTHISEIAFDIKKKADPAWKEAIDKNMARSRKTRDIPEQWPATLDTAFDACLNEEDYSANFKIVGWTAAHGPEYLIEQVQKFVPVGHRLKMLQYHEDAVEMLGKLKDANAIKYLETAAAGARKSDDRDWLFETVDTFKAYQDLRRTMRATVPNWGSPGMEKGAFLGRGESLAIAADSTGNLWVSDTGNNRVQRLTAQGTADKIIGHPERGIDFKWMGDEGQPYAAAAKSGEGPSEFTHPFDLDVGNYDVLAVVDATLKVRTFDAEGAPKAQWQLESNYRPVAGAGVGSPIVTWLGDDFYFIVKNEVFIYSADGELKTRYTLEGGTAQCAVIAAGGKLLVRHVGEQTITEYKPQDGFRQGDWVKKGVPEDGSEDWDMTTDDKDNVWVVTDAGNVYVFNKRGKYVRTYVAWERGRDLPRIAVWSNMVYISSAKEEITRIEQEQ